MTSTTTFGGFNPEGRNSSKVLKPPGGGSSDIFGTTGGQQSDAATPRRVKNHQQSNLFLNDDPTPSTPARNQGKDTYSRLFGPPPATPSSCTKNRMKSNILLSNEDNANSNTEPSQPKSPDSTTDSTDSQMNGQAENGHHEEVQTNGGGAQQNGMNGNANGNMNGNPAPQAPARNRVPPGGYSSGLW